MDGVNDILVEARNRFDRVSESDRKSRQLAQEDLLFVGGEQWPEQIKNQRQAADRPCLTVNRLPQFTQQVIGDARQNKPAIRVSPVDDGSDPDTADVLEGLIRNIEVQSKATQAYIAALGQAVEGAFGHWRVITEYSSDDSFEQDIRIKRITDPFSVHWDDAAKEYDKSDATFCFVTDWIHKKDFEKRYPDAAPNGWEEDFKGLGVKESWMVNDRVRLCEYFVKKPVKKTIAQLADGRVVDLPKEHPGIGSPFAGSNVVKTRQAETHKVCRYLLSGHAVLEDEREIPSKYIPIVSVYGPEQYVEGQFIPRSLVRFAKDPQRMFNFWQTSNAEKIALTPKSPYIVTPKQISGYESEWKNANRSTSATLLYNPDPESPGVPQRDRPADINAAEIQQSQQAIDDLKATMGMYDASLGGQGNESSGRAIMARQREGDTASFSWIDNLSWSIEHTGRILIDMIPRIYDTERVVRVLGADDSVDMVPINQWDEGLQGYVHDLTVGKYDVTVSAGPSYATKRQEAAESMLQFMQVYPNAAPYVGDLIAKNMDWPGADEIAERLRKLLPPGVAETEDDDPEAVIAGMTQQIQQLMAQLEEMSAELEKHSDAETEYKNAQAFKTNEDGRAQSLKNIAVETGQAPLEIL